MNSESNRISGFTIIELSLVLIVLGILAAALAPLVQNVHRDSLNEQDDEYLETARDALLGYIRINQAIPCAIPDPVTGDPVQIIPFGPANPTTPCDPATTLELLGMRTEDARGKTFALDVNNDLTEAALGPGGDICTALANIVSPLGAPVPAPTLDPQVCEEDNANTGDTACTPAPTPTMAFVLVGRGADRCLNLENTHASAVNDAVCQEAVDDNRIFENPARRQSLDVDDAYYEDLVYAVTPTELADLLDCPAGGGGGASNFYCASGGTLVQLINGNGAPGSRVGLEVDPAPLGTNGCFQVQGGTVGGIGCQPDASRLLVYTGGNCSGAPDITVDPIGAAAGSNGRVDILCDNSSNCTAN